MKYKNLREEEIKIRVGDNFFPDFDCASIIQNVDFSVQIKSSGQISFLQYLLWAEAKAAPTDITIMLAQLVLTIRKSRTFNEILPPPFLGCFDCEKIAFVHYHEFLEIFHKNDFNWNVTPSNRETREFKIICDTLKKVIDKKNIFIFDFEKDEKELKKFIKENFIVGKMETSKIRIDKNNFINIYNKWLDMVKPTIMLLNWEKAKKAGIIDGDFYLADLLSSENQTLKEKLYVILKQTKYVMDRHEDEYGLLTSKEVDFSDKQRAHTKFWAIYERPPKEEYWDYIIERRDLLVPQDVRERKGSFYTPKIWVELSQKYIADVFGENWQDEYYVWDCAAGTGNLLAGLTNKYNIYASTLDKADVDVMHDRIDNGANLLKEHCFQFDFLNDEFEKLPQKLQDIIKKTPEKLIIYINPPYADASSNMKAGKKAGNSFNKIHNRYKDKLGSFSRELYALFLIRIYFEIPDCRIAEFSKLKLLSVTHAEKMRNYFLAKLEKMFVVPADTFDNVTGKFPIGFKVWNLSHKKKFQKVKADVFDKAGKKLGTKVIHSYDDTQKINRWITNGNGNANGKNNELGYVSLGRNDMQNRNVIFITNEKSFATNYFSPIYLDNLIEVCIYLSVQKVVTSSWINDRDQFLFPNKKWKKDKEFQNDCLTFTLFHDSNNISSKHGVNHWIPFFENEINASEKFESHFLLSFMNGKIIPNGFSNLFEQQEDKIGIKLEFSSEATAVFDAGRELWKYYHSKPKVNVNASFYDIREYFQGRSDKTGNMNSRSEDEKYTELISNLREKMKILAKKIEPKVYEYEFLRE
ncbi:MAG: hypothetical protein FWF51_03680 [Chitinivibrionia bacterium]|nr:hypothetical protein [Chitinivibrionia bacterium]